MKKPDEIMAEYLLRGGKMLAKTCPECASPLFEYKGDPFCVVCAEQARGEEGEQPEPGKAVLPGAGAGAAKPAPVQGRRSVPADDDLAAELRSTVAHFCARARQETDPENALILMDCALRGVEALDLLAQR